MLAKANIDEELISNLGDGMRHLGEQAAKMGEAADVAPQRRITRFIGRSNEPSGIVRNLHQSANHSMA